MRHRIITASFSLAALTLLAQQARANDGTPPEIFQLLQEGQDVVITFGIHDPWGEPGIGQEFNLTRSGPEGEVLVFENKTFDAADAEIRDPHCHFYEDGGDTTPEEHCATHPEDCEDCDGDDVLDCPTDGDAFSAVCAAFLTYEAVDACVPAGQTGYVLETPGNDSSYQVGSASIDVVESGEECEAADEGDSGGSGCSVSGVGGSGAATPAFALLIGLLGAVALRRGRNRG